MQETEYIFLNDKFVKWNEAKIHILTHALHYGSAAFEGIRAYKTEKGGAIFRLKDHVKRLIDSFSIFEVKHEFDEKKVEKAIIETLKINKLEEAYIRPILFLGYGEMGLRNIDKCEVNFSVAAWPWPKYLAKDLLNVKIVKTRRISQLSLRTNAKISGHYVNSILASIESKKANCDEALLLDIDGNVAEGPGENIFLVKNKKLYTPKLNCILPGITRDSVIKIAKDLGIEVIEKDIKEKELFEADELFFTGTAIEITGIGTLDGKTIGKGKIGEITEKLREKYLEIVHGKDKNYENWLFRVY